MKHTIIVSIVVVLSLTGCTQPLGNKSPTLLTDTGNSAAQTTKNKKTDTPKPAAGTQNSNEKADYLFQTELE